MQIKGIFFFGRWESDFKNDINANFLELNDRFKDFQAEYEMVNSNLSISKRNELLLELITQLDRNNLNNAWYNRRETLEINPVPYDIADDVLEQSVCRALSLTGISVEPDDLQSCHRMRKKDRVIIKFKCRNFVFFQTVKLYKTKVSILLN